MNQEELPLRECSLIVASVVLAHALLMWYLATMPDIPRLAHHEMSVIITTMPGVPQAAPVKPEVKPRTDEPRRVLPEVATPVPVATLAVPGAMPDTTAASVAPPAAIPAATPAEKPAVEPVSVRPVNVSPPDHGPDYLAAYLDNPAPSYPMVARRMGWQGKVVLNVEVLANGLPGQIKLHQSSGHDVLDNAALQAVRGWRFTAAFHGGQAVSRWFLVPIPFILKED